MNDLVCVKERGGGGEKDHHGYQHAHRALHATETTFQREIIEAVTTKESCTKRKIRTSE